MNKRKKQEREIIVQEISRASISYKSNLVGKRFMYVFDNRYIEVTYKSDNFKHLTGVDTCLSANEFYRNAVRNKLQPNQIYFSQKHPYSLCKRKIKHINEIAHLASTENFILEEIVTDSKKYRFGTTDLKFTLCLNKEYDKYGNEKSECYIAQSLRDGDCFDKSSRVHSVIFIFERDNDKKYYSRCVFAEESQVNLPSEIRNMLDENAIESMQHLVSEHKKCEILS